MPILAIVSSLGLAGGVAVIAHARNWRAERSGWLIAFASLSALLSAVARA